LGTVPLQDRQPGHSVLPHRRSDEKARSQNGSAVNGKVTHAATRGSFDGIIIPDNPFQDPAFSASLQDLIPIDMSSRATPDSTSTGGSVSLSNSYQGQQVNGQNPLHKLDSLMFPSDDPFAYPNQPMMELGYQHQKRPSGHMGNQHSSDAANLFMSGSFDDIDSQLLGQMPPFLMQDQGQPGLDLGGSVFRPSSLMGMQQSQSHHRGHQARRAQLARHQEREIEQLFAQQGFQPDWAGVFARGSFQGL
jgi:hypothetical protein